MNFDPLTITHLHPVWLASLRGMVVLLVCHLLYILCLKRGSVALRNVFWRWTIGASIAVAILSFLPALVHIEVPAETPVHREIAPVEIEAGSTEPSQPVATPTQSWHPNYNQLALGLWAVVAAILMLRWPLAHLLLIRLKKGARTINDARWLQTLNDVQTTLGLSRKVDLYGSTSLGAPLEFGLLRSTVMIPTTHLGANAKQRRAILLHELTHIQRRDALYLLLAMIGKAVHWSNPLVWIASHQLRQDEERAPDDRVLEHGVCATAYAELLLSFSTQDRVPVGAISMAQCSMLENRISAILCPKTNRTKPNRTMKTTMIVGFLSFVIAVGSVFVREAQAQDEPLYTSSYRAPENFIQIATQDLNLKPKASSSAVTPKQILEAAKVEFPEGASAFYQEKRSMLIVRNTQTNMKLVDALIDKYADKIKPRDGTEPVGENGDDDPGAVAIAKMLNKIVIPQARFEGASLKEAIDWLRAETIKLDPEKKGVPITIAPSIPKGGSSITLNLIDLPASAILRYITGLADVGYHVSATGVTIKPLTSDK